MATDEVVDSILSDEFQKLLGGNNSKDFFEDEGEDKKLFGEFHDKEFFNQDASDEGSCKRILYETLSDSNHTRVWDVLILIPNLCFLAFLSFRLKSSLRKLASSNVPMMTAFHHMVFVCSTVGVSRCIVSIIGSNVTTWNETSDKVLWLILRAFLLATEISVLAFAILTGHLDTKSSIRRVVVVASTVSMVFSSIQAGLEFAVPDPAFHVGYMDIHLFGHGGRVFWGISSAVFAVAYGSVIVLPMLPCRHWFMLPHKRSFYYYASFLLVLNLVQCVGCGLTESNEEAVSNPGLCFVSMTTYIYFVAFVPIVFFTFLSPFFGGGNQPSLLFSYKAQTDDIDDDFERDPNMDPANGSEDLFMQESNTPIIINGQLGTHQGFNS